jgi:hypothetical protein
MGHVVDDRGKIFHQAVEEWLIGGQAQLGADLDPLGTVYRFRRKPGQTLDILKAQRLANVANSACNPG